jgi:hypothetical protein
MLISVEVENFRSFYDRTIFSMETGSKLRSYSTTNTHRFKRLKLLKSAFIFGGNANGKTNVINIFYLLKALIMNPRMSEVEGLLTDTFAGDSKPTYFLVKFLKNNKIFTYELEYIEERVIKESLVVNDRMIFSRNGDEVFLPDSLTPLSSTIRKNQLLLFFAQTNNILEAKEAYEWFVVDIVIPDTNDLNLSILKELKQNKALKRKLILFLQAADFNILDIEVRERVRKVPSIFSFSLNNDNPELKTGELVERKVVEIYCIHQKNNDDKFVLNLSEESEGTKIFLILATYILRDLERNTVFLIDEFDASLHIKLTEVLLKLFNQWNQRSQFIVTSHSFDLMDKNLRPDQIYFVEKDRFGKSELYSLFDFDDVALKRHDYKYKRRYLQGIYGADQIINESAIAETLGVDYE